MEKTFVMIKPDVTLRKTRGIIGDIINRIEKTGLKIKALKMKKLDGKELSYEEIYRIIDDTVKRKLSTLSLFNGHAMNVVCYYQR